MTQHLPANSMPSAVLTPSLAAHLPAQIMTPILQVYMNALHTVFLARAGITLIAFGLSWTLTELAVVSRPRINPLD